MTWLGAMTAAMLEHRATSPRSLQVATGASQTEDCTAAAMFRLRGEPHSDPRLSWQAEVGTAVHAHVLPVLAAACHGQEEVRVSFKGLPATIDLLSPPVVVDLKTATADGLADRRRTRMPKSAHRAQVHVGAAGAIEAGHDVTTVAILYVPRDGDLSDAWEWSEACDERRALDALERVQRVNALAASDARPEDHRDQPKWWCEQFCAWVTACRGAPEPPAEVDTEALTTAAAWLQARQDEDDAAARRMAAAAILARYDAAGLDLRGAGVRFQWGGAETVVDDAAVRSAYEQMLGALPTRPGSRSRSPRKAGR